MGLLFPAVLHLTHTKLHKEKSELALSRFSSCVMLETYKTTTLHWTITFQNLERWQCEELCIFCYPNFTNWFGACKQDNKGVEHLKLQEDLISLGVKAYCFQCLKLMGEENGHTQDCFFLYLLIYWINFQLILEITSWYQELSTEITCVTPFLHRDSSLVSFKGIKGYFVQNYNTQVLLYFMEMNQYLNE